MASVYRRKDTDVLWLKYKRNGKIVRESSGTKDPVEAEKLLKKKIDALNDTSMTYQEAVVIFFQTADLKPSTVKRYKTSAKAWHPYCANLRMNQIDEALLKTFVMKRKVEGVSDPGVRRDLAFLSSLFSYAMEMPNGPASTPFATFKKKRLKEKKRTRFLTDGEFQKLLNGCTTDMQRSILKLAVETGLRSGELMALTWDQVDFKRRQITVGSVVGTKTGNVRTVPLNKNAVGTLLGTPRADTPYVFWYLDWRNPKVIHGPDGTRKLEPRPAPYTTFKNFWTKAVERAGLPDLRFHDLRHTFASWWMQRGGSEAALQHILGHTSMAMTARYRHLRPVDIERQVAAVSESIGMDIASVIDEAVVFDVKLSDALRILADEFEQSHMPAAAIAAAMNRIRSEGMMHV